MSEEHSRADIKFFFGLFLGGIVGALIVFFLGTKEGKKAGKLIEEKSKKVLDDVKEKVEELEVKGKELIDHGNEIKEQVIETLEEKKDELTEAASAKLESALSQIEQLQEQSLNTTAEIRKRYFKNIPKKR